MAAQAVSDAVSRATLPGSRPSTGQAVVAAVTGSLAAHYQDSWPHAMAGVPLLWQPASHRAVVQCNVTGRDLQQTCALPAVTTELLAVLGPAGAPLAAPLLARLDEIARDAAAAEDAEDGQVGGSADLAAARRGAEGALGAAVRSLGPEAVLDTLPLRLEEVRLPALWHRQPLRLWASLAGRVWSCRAAHLAHACKLWR